MASLLHYTNKHSTVYTQKGVPDTIVKYKKGSSVVPLLSQRGDEQFDGSGDGGVDADERHRPKKPCIVPPLDSISCVLQETVPSLRMRCNVKQWFLLMISSCYRSSIRLRRKVNCCIEMLSLTISLYSLCSFLLQG